MNKSKLESNVVTDNISICTECLVSWQSKSKKPKTTWGFNNFDCHANKYYRNEKQIEESWFQGAGN